MIGRPREAILNSKFSFFQRKWPFFSCENGIFWKNIVTQTDFRKTYLKFIWTSIPEIGPADVPEIEFPKKKKLDEFSRNRSVSRKWKFRENFWLSFLEIYQ